MPKVLDLFSGIGGMTLGLQEAGYETVAFCEIEPSARFLLQHHWPNVKIYDDVTEAEFSEPVDLVAAGFPCQDISQAGKRAGITGERSGLFWAVLRAVCMVGRPKLLLENVAALLGRGMGDVCGALAEIGYDAEWNCIPASAIGAPHNRDRNWIVADPIGGEQSRQEPRSWTVGRVGGQQQPFPWDQGWREALTSFRGMDDGVPRSVDRTDGLRNAVVPPLVAQIAKQI
ncbi:DNA cytosine methyltransferase [Pseudovibrio japonicus]|uniref:DNA cytosine methyltransferase n=1 Tax=Pseudovibrio japonicus TaxID=366534 RepID=UPI001677D2AD|nr:DNA (cytosine-5-)-methyltransferase [Pseudovibrio japonicus]